MKSIRRHLNSVYEQSGQVGVNLNSLYREIARFSGDSGKMTVKLPESPANLPESATKSIQFVNDWVQLAENGFTP